MPSIEESKRQVKQGLGHLRPEIDHDAILAAMEEEIDSHNQARKTEDHDSIAHGHRKRRHDASNSESLPRTRRFRFKSGTTDPRERGRAHQPSRRKRHHRSKSPIRNSPTPQHEYSAHPFPREPTDPQREAGGDSQAAFRESLFDALADDEGAAYWESVYNQPIHIYPRPTVETPQGELEQMDDDQYAAYVQTKMWEKTHPHIVQERERTAKRKKEEEEETARRRQEFVRRKERAAWERAQQAGARKFAGLEDDDAANYEYVFDFEGKTNSASRRSFQETRRPDYGTAWAEYLAAWEKLKSQPESARGPGVETSRSSLEKQIPWPVLASQPIVKHNIEAFFQNVPVERSGRSRLQLLKAERVRWHPDKTLQRFGDLVDGKTMKLVTSIFQIVDELVEHERKRES